MAFSSGRGIKCPFFRWRSGRWACGCRDRAVLIVWVLSLLDNETLGSGQGVNLFRLFRALESGITSIQVKGSILRKRFGASGKTVTFLGPVECRTR